MHSLVEEQENSGRLLSPVLVMRVDWKTAQPPHHHVVTVKMLVLSAQSPVSTEINLH